MSPTSPSTRIRTRLAANRQGIRARIFEAAQAAGRDPTSVELIAVTKSVPARIAKALFDLGESQLAENRLNGLEAKLECFGEKRPTWHFIGHLQRNKARRVLEHADTLHSIDSLRLLEHCARLTHELKIKRTIYLQVKIADEKSKYGFAPAELEEAVEAAALSPSLQLAGLMCMAPLLEHASNNQRTSAASVVFETTRDLLARWPELKLGLSMGMTGDFEAAIAAGSTQVRIGSAFFEGLESEAPYA